MTVRLLISGLAVLAVAVIAVGCGGSGDGESTSITTSSITKAEFVKQANAICRQGQTKMLNAVLAYDKKYSDEDPVEAATQAIQEAPPFLETQGEEIRALGAPAGDAGQIEAFLAALQRSIHALEEEEPSELGGLDKALEPVSSPATTYGLVACRY